MTDFAQAIGSVCGVWLVDGTTASDYAEATSLLAKDLDGSSGGSSDKTDSGSSATATDAAAATASSTKSDNAAAATMGPGLVGIMGAAAVAALL